MKKTLTFLIMTMILVLTACGGNTDSTSGESTEQEGGELEAVTLKLGHVGSEQSGNHIGATYFAERVSELSDGKVKVEIYPGAQLGGERDLVENISNGSLSMAAPGLPVIGNFTNAFMGMSMPFLVENSDVERELYKSELITGDAFKELEKLNIKGLGFISTGFFQFGNSKKPLNNIEDFKGISIRSTENPMMVDAYQAVGLSATPMPFPDMYTSLQTGVIDAGALQNPAWISEKMIEVVDHISIVNALPYPHFIMINLQEFNSLPKEYQDAIVQAGNETTDYMFDVNLEMEKEALQEMKDMGISVVEDFDSTGISEAIQPVMDKYADDAPIIKQTFELIKELNAKY